MEFISLDCQVCLTKFNRIRTFKNHVHSEAHQKKMEEVFQKDTFKGHGSFPHIIVLNLVAKKDFKRPIVGLSLLTLCFSRETKVLFYLCHVCEEKCPTDKIARHLSSGDHCSNYFNYTNPNLLSFSWIPSMDMKVTMRAELTKEVEEKEPGRLQMLDLPANLLKKLEGSTYSEVMSTLGENDKLLKLMEAVKPKRTMIQTYQRDSNRKHRLLGMQHLVECICVGPTERRHYLCTLCNLTLATHMIIKHVLSFDHIFCYFNAWHPSTLLSKECYQNYTTSFAAMILDFAKQTEEIHGTANADMKQVSLEPAKFSSVNFSCYAEALKDMESIRKENKENSLIPRIKPGKKLECRLVSAKSESLPYKLRCQDCNVIFANISEYNKHLSKEKHQQMLENFFGKVEGADGYVQKVWTHSLGLYRYLMETWKKNCQLPVGVPLVVTCICTQAQVKPMYMCFACQDCFPESFLRQHFDSRKHLICTLLYQNPWRLPFAWENQLDVKVLMSEAWEEEQERGLNQMMLKVFDIPFWIFGRLIPSFSKVMLSLDQQLVLLKREVPPCETNSKLRQSERFPELGKQFLVTHAVCYKWHESTEMGFLCLLCERRLSDEEFYAHVFSWEHVATFLERFHPGSLNSSTDAETLLDLAKQAAGIHSESRVQEIKLDKPIWEPCPYQRVISILVSAKKRHGKGNLVPPIKPKTKLVPREILKDVDKTHVEGNSEENSQKIQGSEKENNQKSTDNSGMTLQKMSEEIGAEITSTSCAERGENAENGAVKETPLQSEKESEREGEMSSKRSSEEMNKADHKTCQGLMEENIEEPPVKTPRRETPESCQNTDKADRTEIGEESIRGSQDVLIQSKNYIYKGYGEKRPRSISEKSQEDTCPDEDVEREKGNKRQRITSRQEVSCEEPQILPGSKQKEVTTVDEQESGEPSHKTSKDKESSNVNHPAVQLWQYVRRTSREPVIGLGALTECCCDQNDPIYLCECCSLKIPEKDIISHVTGADHQKMYLRGLQKLPPSPEKHQGNNIRYFAVLVEQEIGCGEAEVVDLDDEIYNNLSKQNFKSAMQTVKALQAQASVTDDFQVVDKEVEDDSKDSEAQPSSVTAAEFVITSKTTEVPIESNKDVKLTQIKESGLADNANNHLTVSKNSENTSIPHVSTCRTKTACLHSDFTGNDLKAEISSNTTVEPLKIAATSKIKGTSQYAATVDFSSMAVVSKVPVMASSSPSGTTKLTAPITSFSATISSCTTTPSTTCKSRETAYKCAATTSTVTATTPKRTAAHPKSSTLSKIGNASKIFGTSLQSMAASQTMVKYVECKNAEASAKKVPMKDSVGPNADVAPNDPKSNAHAPLQLTALMCGRSENKNSPTEPSHTSSKTKPKEGPPTVGRNQLIIVSCGKRQQVYCQLCSVRLRQSHHLISFSHQYNYVKMMFPGWTAKPFEFGSRLDKIVCHLAMVEKDMGSQLSQTLEVENGVYQELAALQEDKALERLKAMLRERNLQGSSSSTRDAAEDLRLQVSVKEETFESDVASQATGQVTPAIKSPESTGRSAQTPDTYHESAETRRQQDRKDLELQDTHTLLERTQKTSSVKSLNSDPLPSATAVKTEQQNLSRPSQKSEYVPKHSGCSQGPGYHSASQKLSTGERTQGWSHLSTYLHKIGNKPVIGLGTVWECRGEKKSFFLCESCKETLSRSDVCQHMISTEHQLKYGLRQYPQFMWFWKETDLLEHMKLDILKGVVGMLSQRERFNKVDAKVIQLTEDLYKQIRTTPFSEALKMVENLKKELKLSCKPISTQQKDQQTQDRQSTEECLSTEKQSTQALKTDQSSDKEARHKTENHHLEETVVVGDLDGVKQRRVSIPLDVTSVSSKADSLVLPIPVAGACYNSQETSKSLSVQPELRPLVSQHLRPVAELQVKKAEVHSESPPSSVVGPKTSQTLSVSHGDKCLSTMKRPAVTSLQALVRPCSSNPHLEDSMPAKCTRSSLQPIGQSSTESASGSTRINPAATSTLLCPKDRDAGPGSDEQDASIMDLTNLERLASLVRERKCLRMSAPSNAKTTTAYADISTKRSLERSWDPRYAHTNFKMEKGEAWDSKGSLHKVTVKISPPSNEGLSSTAAPVVSGSAFLTDKCSLEGHLAMKNLLFGATEAKEVATMLPSASTDYHSDPKHQSSVNAQSMFGNVIEFRPFHCVATNQNPGQIPQPKRQTETYSTNHLFIANRANQAAPSFSTAATAISGDNLAASGGCGQHSQLAYVPNGQVASYTMPNNPPAFTGSLYQQEEGFTTQPNYYPSQIYPEQAHCFGHNLATLMLLGLESLERQQQLMLQHQYPSWSSAGLAPGGGTGANEAANIGSVPFYAPANSSQRFIDFNDYKTI